MLYCQREDSIQNIDVVSTPKIESSLHRTSLQRSFIASGPQDITSIALGTVVARQNKTALLIENTSDSSPTLHNPPSISGKPQTQSSPTVAHNDPGEGEHSPPNHEFAGASKPDEPNPDISDDNTRDYVNSTRPGSNSISNNNGGVNENDSGNSYLSGNNDCGTEGTPDSHRRHQPETD